MTTENASSLTRRAFFTTCTGGLAGALLFRRSLPLNALGIQRGSPRLSARPSEPTKKPVEGLTTLALDDAREGLLYVPKGLDARARIPLAVMLHGATLRATSQINLLSSLSDDRKFAILAVKSLGITWDAIRGDYGPDIRAIDAAIRATFDQVHIDPRRVAVGGFSDGASYALALGLSNGDLFTHGIAFSAGFIPATDPQGRPRLFISHGTEDQILPVDTCGRRIAATLRRARYAVEYREFPGPHTVPIPIATAALDWLLAG
jgi:phospholipase/carboxylesterase